MFDGIASFATSRLRLCRLFAAAVTALVLLAPVATTNAQGVSSNVIRIIVPFTPGGSNDVVAREIAAGLRTQFNRAAVVENKAGGGGAIAYSYVAKLPPDGQVLLVAPGSFTIGPHLSRNPTYNPVTDFAPINLIANVPFVMVVPASLPVRTVKEFVELAKKSPNPLTFGSVGVGTPQHLGGELFKMQAGVDLLHVPFRGASPVIPELLAGRIDMYIGAINSLLPLIQEGKLRPLAVASRTRVPSLPDVPTMTEAGLPAVEVGSAVGLVAPARTAPEVVATLNREIAAIIATPEFHQRMATIGVDVIGTTPAAYAKIISDDYTKWGQVVTAARIERE